MLERPVLGDLEQSGRPRTVLRPEHLGQLLRGPRVGQALDALGVGVQGRGERALGGAEVAEHEGGCLQRDPAREGRSCGAVQVRVDPQQLGVVVEHLLEVRDHPVGVDGVAREAAAELVVHPAARHRLAACARPGTARRASRCGRGGAAGTRAPSTAGTSAPRRSRPALRRTGRTAARRHRPGRPRRWGAPEGRRRSPGAGPRSCRPSRAPARAGRSRRRARPAGAGGSGRGGSRCRSRTARRRASGSTSSASHPARSARWWRPCRRRRCRAAPRGRP